MNSITNTTFGQSVTGETPGKKWWLHHVAATKDFAAASLQGDPKGALKALDELWNAVLRWQEITRSEIAGVLMAEHTALAKQFVEGLVKKDDALVAAAAESLANNVEEQSKLFPVEPVRFGRLFAEHVRLMSLYVEDLANGDKDGFNTHFTEALRNADDLGAFTNYAYFGGITKQI